MKRFSFIYFLSLFSLFSLFFFSCKDDLSLSWNQNNEEAQGTNLLNVSVDIPELRTRAIDMTDGTAVYLDKVWIGIYDVNSGLRVGGTDLVNEVSLNHRLTASGVELRNLVEIKFDEEKIKETQPDIIDPAESLNLVVVGVANYDNPTDPTVNIYSNKLDINGNNIPLFDLLKEADTWDKFKDIAINTQSNGFANNTPMLMGYYYPGGETASEGYIYTKVDQFAGTGSKINLYPEREDMLIKAKKTNGVWEIDEKYSRYVMKFRRLRSKINVKIEPAEDITITSVQYQVHNSPNSVYLAQRRTNIFSSEYRVSDPHDLIYSPNSADRESDENITDEINGYTSQGDDEWTSTLNVESFSFEHFENKHWTLDPNFGFGEEFENINDPYILYHARERKDENGNYIALGSGWNSNASYFKLRLGVRDNKTGRNADVIYTIHEGFCNDKDGVEYQLNGNNQVIRDNQGNPKKLEIKDRVKDFSCVRNTNYTYHITVTGVESIKVQVTGEDDHTFDQTGSIWQINYFKNKLIPQNEVTVPSDASEDQKIFLVEDSPFAERFTEDYNHYYLKFQEEKIIDNELRVVDIPKNDIAFRLIGTYYDKENKSEVPVDVCYNFGRGELDGFAGLWPTPTLATEYMVETTSTTTTAYSSLCDYYDKNEAFREISKQIMIIAYDDKRVTLKQFIDEYIEKSEETPEEEKKPYIEGLYFEPLEYYDVEKKGADLLSDVKALYVFDRQRAAAGGERVANDGAFHLSEQSPCSYYYEIFGGVQAPIYKLKDEKYEMVFATGDQNEYLAPVNGYSDPNGKKFNKFPGKYEINNNINNGKGMILSDDHDLAIRILGCDTDGKKYDLCYNFDPKDYPTLANSWPSTVSSRIIEKGNLVDGLLPESLLEGLKIYEGNKSMNVIEFVNYCENSSNYKTGKKFGFDIADYNYHCLTDPDEGIRALYVFDKKNRYKKPAILSSDDVATYQVYGVVQYPYDNSFSEKDMLWTSEFYQTLDGDLQHWCGGRYVVTEMFWKHKPWIKKYNVQVVETDDTKDWYPFKPESTLIENPEKYIIRNDKNEDIIRFPYTVTGYSVTQNDGYYTVIITPEYDNSIVSQEPIPIVLTNKLKISTDTGKGEDSTWTFSNDIWKNNLKWDLFKNQPNLPVIFSGLMITQKESYSAQKDTDFTDGFIQLASGNVNKNYLSIYLFKKGTLSITADHSKKGVVRKISIYKENEDGTFGLVTKHNIIGQDLKNNKGDFDIKTIDIDVTTPTRYRICCEDEGKGDGDTMRYYKIQFK